MMYHIVMLSGGVDSTGALFYALEQNKPGRVFVHHVIMHDRFGRNIAEQRAVRKIVEWCRREWGELPLTTSTHEYQSAEWLLDLPIIGFYAALVAMDISNQVWRHKIDDIEVLTGDNADDWQQVDFAERRETQNLIFNAYFRNNKARGLPTPVLAYPNDSKSKQLVYNTIPKVVRLILFSCRQPVNIAGSYMECGVCHHCQEIHRVRKGAEE